MANLSVLVKSDEYEYIWCFDKAKILLDNYCKKEKITKVSFYKMISDECYITEEAVKNWFTGKNGPREIEQVRMIAEHLEVNYMDLLFSLEEEKDGFMDELLEEMLNMTGNNDLNYTTVKFISMLNELARKSEVGFIEFSKIMPDDDRDGIIYIDEDNSQYGEIVLDMCVDEIHHDVVSTYNQRVREVNYDARVRTDEDEMFIEISISDNDFIVIHDGRWYFC